VAVPGRLPDAPRERGTSLSVHTTPAVIDVEALRRTSNTLAAIEELAYASLGYTIFLGRHAGIWRKPSWV